MNGILSRGSRLPIKEAESKRKLTRKLFELSPPERVEKGRSDSSTKLRFRDEAKPKRKDRLGAGGQAFRAGRKQAEALRTDHKKQSFVDSTSRL